ncbi:hypothetical protein UlMin_028372 [Ulmus minor]
MACTNTLFLCYLIPAPYGGFSFSFFSSSSTSPSFSFILSACLICRDCTPYTSGLNFFLSFIFIYFLFFSLYSLTSGATISMKTTSSDSACIKEAKDEKCSTTTQGDLTNSNRAVVGIFGFGQNEMSVISQSSLQGVAPKVLSHCLSGDNIGGGILVLGEIGEPNIVCSPLVPNLPHYNLHLLDITVNGQAIPINPSVFAASTNGGTIVDSGTTLPYLTQDAVFTNAINNAVSQYAMPAESQGTLCYAVTSSITNIFPQVVLHFAGGATIVLGPNDYLLEDKIVVYDSAGQRIGCPNYDYFLLLTINLYI